MENSDELIKRLDKKMAALEGATEVEVDKSSDVSSEVHHEVEKEYSEDERHALSLGWKPEGKKNAKQWLNDYPLMKEINKLSKENKDLAALVKSYINEQNEEKKYHKEQEIKTMRREAIKMGDVDLVEQIDAQTEKMKAPPVQSTVDKVFADFFERYPGIFQPDNLDDLEVKDYFLKTDAKLGNHLPPEKHMKLLEEALHKKFPKYFGKEEEDELYENLTSPVESGIQSNVKKTLRKRYTERDLDAEQLATFKSFQHYKIPITIEQYIDRLIKQGDLK